MEITLGMGASQNDAMVRAAQKLLKLHQNNEVTINDSILPEVKALSNGDTGFAVTILDTNVVFTYSNKDYAMQWIPDEFAVVGNITTRKPPVKTKQILLAKIETCGIEHIDYPNAVHTALKKLIEMHDAGEIEIDCEEEVRVFTGIKPKITMEDGEKCYSARFMEAFEEISELGLEQFFRIKETYFDIQVSNNNSEVIAVPH